MFLIANAALLAISAMTSSNTPRLAGPMNSDVTTFSVLLTGAAESNAMTATAVSGDMDGSGRVELTVDLARRRICYDFTLSGLATPLMAHIHRGGARRTGPSVVTLFTGPSGDLSNCLLWTEKHLSAIVDNPADFYVNLSTTEFPDGALRGQLS